MPSLVVLAVPLLPAIAAAVLFGPTEATAQGRRASSSTVLVTQTNTARPRPASVRQRVEVLGRLVEGRRLDATALAEPVRLRPSKPNHADRVYASLRTGTTITGPMTEEAWVLTGGSGGLTSVTPRLPGGRWVMRSSDTPLTDLFGAPRLALTIRAAALKSKALVECGFRAEGDGPLALGGTIPAQTITLKNGSGHLNVVVEPVASGENVELFLEHMQGTPPVAFTYCEITALK